MHIKILENSEYKIKLPERFKEFDKLVPEESYKTLRFSLTDTSQEFANALRRVSIYEKQTRCLHVDLSNIHTDDPYIIPDILQMRLTQLPISQDIPVGTTYALYAENKDQLKIEVLSNSLKLFKGSFVGGFSKNVVLMDLMYDKKLKIDNIVVQEQIPLNNPLFAITSFEYKDITPETSMGDYMVESNSFTLAIKGRYINTIQYLTECLDIISERAAKMIKAVNDGNIRIVSVDNLTSYTFVDETHTMGGLFVRYIYNLQNSIDMVTYKASHPSVSDIIISIRHQSPASIFNEAGKSIIADVADVKRQITVATK